MHTRQSSGKAIWAAVVYDRTRRVVVRALVVLGLCLSSCLWRVPQAGADQTFTVTNADDGGSGSLRIALGLNNLSGGNNTIVFDPTFFAAPRTIHLEGSLPAIGTNVIINGPGANLLTIAGDNQSRVLIINNGVLAILNGVTITGGNAGADAGGGILNNGDLTITGCHITGNSAAFGGGISDGNSASGLVIQQSTISNNIATGSSTGGGISSLPSVTIINSTISGNTVTGSSGGNGGGLSLASGTIENSTIANNSAAGPNSAGGLQVDALTVTLRNTIIAANVNDTTVPDVAVRSGGVIESDGFNLIGNPGSASFSGPGTHDQRGTAATPLDPLLSPLQDNGGPTPTHALRPGSPALDQGASFGDITDQRGATRPFDVAGIAGPGDQSDIGAVEMQAIFVTNADDTGPGSLRQALTDARADSKLDDILFDNALFAVPQTIRLASPLPSILTELNIIGPGANLLTVRRDTGGPYQIFSVFHARASLSGMTIANGEADFGGGADVIEGSLAITDCALTGNHALSSGGGVGVSAGVLTVTGSTISSNFADQSGGGLYDEGGVARVANSTISGNRARSGGAIFNFSFDSPGSRLDVVNCTIANNLATAGSGGILSITRSGASPASTALRNTIIANTDLPNFAVQDESPSQSSVVSRGFNLASDSGEGVLDQPTDQVNKDPMLGPLQYNGDGTPTHMLLVGSPALDKGNSQGIALDQRGLPRSFDIASLAPADGGDNSDIGAVEVQAHIVTNISDDNRSGSLRQVIAAAPAHSDILFDESFSEGVISLGLTGGEILIDKSLTINGPGTTLLTLSGLNANRIFHVGGGGLHVVISDLTIANGKAADVGGGIVSDSNLTLNRCAIVNNAAGGTFAGGGIYLGGSVGTFTDCTWSGNMSVGSGGGVVVVSGNGILTGCTFNGNTSGFRGGAVALENSSGTFTNCTISGNTATGVGGGGISVFGGAGNPLLAVTSSTITENNIGGIRLDGPVTLTVGNSIVANNSDMSLTAVNGAIMTSLGYNLLGNLGVNLAMNDRIINDVKLAPLSDNGGPTQTRALLPGSPAIDQGSSFGLSIDQRGFPRPLDAPSIANADGGDGADIGAFELGLPLPSACAGDCDNNSKVTVDELLTMVNIALGNADVSTCLAGDANNSKDITIDEILTAVHNALSGCPVSQP